MGRPALSSPEVISRLASVGLEPLEPYIHSETPLLMRCIRCGHKTRKTPLLAFVGKGCRKCAYRDLRLTVQEPEGRGCLRKGAGTLAQVRSVSLLRSTRSKMWRKHAGNSCNGASFAKQQASIHQIILEHNFKGMALWQCGVLFSL